MTVFVRGVDDDGEWVVLGEAVSITMSYVTEDGSLMAPPGACPQCREVPLNGEPVVCSHGVAVRA